MNFGVITSGAKAVGLGLARHASPVAAFATTALLVGKVFSERKEATATKENRADTEAAQAKFKAFYKMDDKTVKAVNVKVADLRAALIVEGDVGKKATAGFKGAGLMGAHKTLKSAVVTATKAQIAELKKVDLKSIEADKKTAFTKLLNDHKSAEAIDFGKLVAASGLEKSALVAAVKEHTTIKADKAEKLAKAAQKIVSKELMTNEVADKKLEKFAFYKEHRKLFFATLAVLAYAIGGRFATGLVASRFAKMAIKGGYIG